MSKTGDVGIWLELEIKLPEAGNADIRGFKLALYNRVKDMLRQWSDGHEFSGCIAPGMPHSLEGFEIEVFEVKEGGKVDKQQLTHVEHAPPPGALKEYGRPHIALVGCIADGYQAIGPFVDSEAAEDWSDKYAGNLSPYEILDLTPPMDSNYVADYDEDEELEELEELPDEPTVPEDPKARWEYDAAMEMLD